MLTLDNYLTFDKKTIEASNLTDRFSEEDLKKIGGHVCAAYERDKHSRTSWEQRMEAGMNLAMQMAEAKTFPWPGAANVVFPLVTIAALQFSARSYGNLIQGTDVVKYRVVQEDPDGSLRARADRISKHMSYQVLEGDTGWEEQHDRLFINLAIVGCNFIKTYYSPQKGHNVSEMVPARDLVVDYYAKSIESCARKTHIIPLYRNEVYERVKKGIFDDVLEEPWYTSRAPTTHQLHPHQDRRQGTMPPQPDDDTPFITLEQHCLLDLDGDGYAEPYIVTCDRESKRVLRIVARCDREEDVERTRSGDIIQITPTEYFTKYSFIPSPDGGIYDIGFGILLGPLNEAVNSGINQLLDAGTMSNSTGGFLGRGAKIRGGTTSMAPWEWKRVDSTGDDLRKSMVPLPVREPSTVLFQLLNLLINYTDRVSGSVDIMVGENPGQNTPAETSRAMVEQGMQIYSTIFKRVWRSMKDEFKKLHKLNAIFLPSVVHFGAQGSVVRREDYKSDPEQVVPVADPHITSGAMRIQQATLLRQAALQTPGYNLMEVEKNFLRAIRIDSVDLFYPGPDKVPPLPNPKLAVEQLKLQGKAMGFKMEQQKFMMQLVEDAKLNAAQIEKLKADTAKVLSEVGTQQAAQELQAFEMVLNALEKHQELLNERIQTLMGGSNAGDSGSDNSGGIPGMGNASGNSGASGTPPQMAGGDQGAMGGGGL